MFSEILRIKPVLDPGTSAEMENNLSNRFARVAHRFGKGLKATIKGTIFGIGLGLLAQLLNPLENLEKRIKDLLDKGDAAKDLADRLGAKPGQVAQSQAIAQSIGLAPEKFAEMATAFAKAVETARDEAKTTGGIQTDSAKVVEKFMNEKNLLVGFTSFLTSLKAESLGAGRTTTLANGTVLKTSGHDVRRSMEKAVFGEEQFGAAKDLVNLDMEKQSQKLNLPMAGDFNAAVNKASRLSDMQHAIEAQNTAKNFIESASKATGTMIQQLEDLKQRDEARTTRAFDNFESLQKAAVLIDDLKGILIDTQTQTANILTLLNGLPSLAGNFGTITETLRRIADFTTTIKVSRWFKGLVGGSSR